MDPAEARPTPAALAVGPAWLWSVVPEGDSSVVGTLDAAYEALAGGKASVVLAARSALGASPVAAVHELLTRTPDLAVVVVDDASAPDASAPDAPAPPIDARALLEAGAQDVIEPGALTSERLPGLILAATVRRAAIRAAERRARRHELLHANASEGFALLDTEGRLIDGSPPSPDRGGIGDLSGAEVFSYIVPSEIERVLEVFLRVAAVPGSTGEIESEVLINGQRRWFEATLSNLSHEESVGGILANYWDITERKQAAQAIAFNAALLDAVGQAVVATDPGGVVVYWNPAAAELYGWSADEAVGRPADELMGTSGVAEGAEIVARVRQGERWSGEFVLQRRDGTRFPAWITDTPLYDDKGDLVGMIGVSADISERKQAEQRFETAFAQSPIGMVVADLDGRPTAVNPAICRMLGRTAEQLIGRRWIRYGIAGDQPLGVAVMAAMGDGEDSYTEERRYLRPDGGVVWLEVHVTRVCDPDGTPRYFMAQMQDVTQRKEVEARLMHQALHDELTGLPNRAVLNRELDAALAHSDSSGRRVGVAFIDLDGFKHVNDALGHVVGDELLVQVGERLARNIREGDCVVRFGGDEYVLVCHDVSEESMIVLTETVTAVMTAPYMAQGRVVDLHASVGVTVSRAGSTTHSLLSEADAAMYRAKELGRDRTVVFDDSLRTRSAEVLEGEQALRAALAHDELAVYYQPIVELESDRPVGVEALVRWHPHEGRIVTPGEFIPMAESSGLIVRVGAMVLEKAAAEVAAWNASDPDGPPLWVSVNLSARQLSDHELPSLVAGVLQRSGLPAALLHLEITETVVMQDVAESVAVLEELKRIGVRLSIDDFGTGYSSLAYLKQLPVDVLKIDRSFVRDLGSDADGASIVEAVLSLGTTLRMSCLAEGVETEVQHAALAALGCPLGQGYYWSRPLPGVEALRWLRERGVRTPTDRPGSAARR